MNFRLGDYLVRRPEADDLDALYEIKNNPEVGALLGGFTNGYSRMDLREWIESHRKNANEVLWVVADATTDDCVGHVGLYGIDHRSRTAELGIMLAPRVWGIGLGKSCTGFVLRYGFHQLNLNRISLRVLAQNERAIALYRSSNFVIEGRLRQAQFKGGEYIDVILMSLLRAEYEASSDS